MGVPKFFRWISHRYPCINQVIHQKDNLEMDHFYLDMNGIIHTCSHPGDKSSTVTDEQIFRNIDNYICYLFDLMKPQKTFFLAVDGVAPRAKMTQQRARRFQAATEAQRVKTEKELKGEEAQPSFDSNCITPGTAWMHRLNRHLQEFIMNKMNEDPNWRQVTAILSGHDVPGEGEHKIREYMSYQRSQASYLPDERHCIYGMDADLIFLALTTHELNICILRENVVSTKNCDASSMPFCLTHVCVLRQYIDLEFEELKQTKLQFEYNLEKLVDDWVFMAYLLGNDFIPHLPNMHIHAESLLVLWDTYKVVMPRLDGYLNEYGRINLPRLHFYFKELSKFDVQWFRDCEEGNKWIKGKHGERMAMELEQLGEKKTQPKAEKEKPKVPVKNRYDPLVSFFGNDEDEDGIDDDKEEVMVLDELAELHMRQEEEDDASSGEDDEMEYRMHRRNYYESKLDILIETPQGQERLNQLVCDYIRMLQWIMFYYYSAVEDWDFFYHYHYAPFAIDLPLYTENYLTIPAIDNWGQFDRDSDPVLPFTQQLLIYPPASSYLVPKPFRCLMSGENDSPLAEFFPNIYTTDLNGKLASWEAVVIIPFVDQAKLHQCMQPLLLQLSDAEMKRNRHGHHLVFKCQNLHQVDSRIDIDKILANFYRKHVLRDRKRIDAIYGMPARVIDPRFPSLYRMEFSFQVKPINVQVFERPCQNSSMVLTLKDSCLVLESQQDLEKLAKRILGRPVRIRWPHSVTALPVRIIFDNIVFELEDLDTDALLPVHHDKANPKLRKRQLQDQEPTRLDHEWLSRAWVDERVNFLQRQMTCKRGILLENDCHGLIFCRQLESWRIERHNGQFLLRPHFYPYNEQRRQNPGYMRRNHAGNSRTGFAGFNRNAMATEDCTMYADGLYVDLLNFASAEAPIALPAAIAGHETSKRPLLEHHLKLSSLFVPCQLAFSTELAYFGDIVEIVAVDEANGKVLVKRFPQASDSTNKKDINLGSFCDLYANHLRKSYHTIGEIAYKLNLHPQVVGRLSAVQEVSLTQPGLAESSASPQKEMRVNIGFDLRSKNRSQMIGWSKYDEETDSWKFTDAFMMKLADYMKKFPEVILRMSQINEQVMQDVKLFTPQRIKPRLEQIENFLQEAGHRRSTRISRTSQALSEDWICRLSKLLPGHSSAKELDQAKSLAERQSSDVANLAWKPRKPANWASIAPIEMDPGSLLTCLYSGQELIPKKAANMVEFNRLTHEDNFTLLQRVVFIRQGTNIPMGLKGTIIGVMRSIENRLISLDVLFDRPFAGAVDIRGSGHYCAQNVAPTNLLCLFTDKELLQLARMPEPPKPVNIPPPPITFGSFNARESATNANTSRPKILARPVGLIPNLMAVDVPKLPHPNSYQNWPSNNDLQKNGLNHLDPAIIAIPPPVTVQCPPPPKEWLQSGARSGQRTSPRNKQPSQAETLLKNVVLNKEKPQPEMKPALPGASLLGKVLALKADESGKNGPVKKQPLQEVLPVHRPPPPQEISLLDKVIGLKKDDPAPRAAPATSPQPPTEQQASNSLMSLVMSLKSGETANGRVHQGCSQANGNCLNGPALAVTNAALGTSDISQTGTSYDAPNAAKKSSILAFKPFQVSRNQCTKK